MAINDTVELAIKGTWMGQDHVHTLHFRFLRLSATEENLINDWQGSCLAAYRAIFPVGEHIVKIMGARQVCGALPLRAPAEEGVAAAAGSGTRATATDFGASWFASLTKERTALAGRSRQGRFFISGIVEADVNGGIMQASYLTPLQAYLDTLTAQFGPAGANLDHRLVVHSRKLASVPGSQCQDTSAPVTALLASNLLTTQKSRRSGSGN